MPLCASQSIIQRAKFQLEAVVPCQRIRLRKAGITSSSDLGSRGSSLGAIMSYHDYNNLIYSQFIVRLRVEIRR